jgi:hypothetical protein
MVTNEAGPLSKAKDLATIVSVLAVPLILAVGGWWIQDRIAEQGTRSQYVQIAVGILSTKPPESVTDEQTALRRWAISIVDLYAPVKLSQEGRDALIRERLDLSEAARAWGYVVEGNCGALIILGEEEAFDECMRRKRLRYEETQRDGEKVDPR